MKKRKRDIAKEIAEDKLIFLIFTAAYLLWSWLSNKGA